MHLSIFPSIYTIQTHLTRTWCIHIEGVSAKTTLYLHFGEDHTYEVKLLHFIKALLRVKGVPVVVPFYVENST